MTRETISHRVAFKGKIKSYKYKWRVRLKRGVELISSSASYFLASWCDRKQNFIRVLVRALDNEQTHGHLGRTARGEIIVLQRVQFVHPRSEFTAFTRNVRDATTPTNNDLYIVLGPSARLFSPANSLDPQRMFAQRTYCLVAFSLCSYRGSFIETLFASALPLFP